jgi:uncharacterized membrane protein YgcG
MPHPDKPPVFFVSYARLDTEYEAHRKYMRTFIDDLGAAVATKLARTREGICFFDESSIETGFPWRVELAEALKTVPVGVALCSPSYSASQWCGKEFQVFLDRAGGTVAQTGPTAIVPVLWYECQTLPAAVRDIQYKDDAFPAEYKGAGLRQLVSLKSYEDSYKFSVEVLAKRIVAAAARGLPPIATLDLERVPSAWDRAVAEDPGSHKEGAIAKTCFVFLSSRGWDWQPYPEREKKIGAIAQQISGDLGLRYEEIACDAELPRKLKETRASSVPTVLFGDPTSLMDGRYAQPLREYDDLYLLNCGALVAWSSTASAPGNGDSVWTYLREKVCRQKTKVPPPNHEWRSIFSLDDLETKTRTVIVNIRMRLLEQLLSQDGSVSSSRGGGSGEGGAGEGGGPGGGSEGAGGGKGGMSGTPILKATDQSLTDAAAAQGINVGTAPQIEVPTR